MIFLKFVLAIILVTFITFIYRYFKAKTNYEDIRNLSLDFEEWFFEKSNNQRCRPNQAVFARLYEEAYGENTRALTHFSGNRAVIKQQEVDVIGSFPTKDSQIASQIFPIIQNMENHFQNEFITVKQPMYWIKFVIFLPQEIMQYLGFNAKSTLSKLFGFIVWVVATAISIFGADIHELLLSLFK